METDRQTVARAIADDATIYAPGDLEKEAQAARARFAREMKAEADRPGDEIRAGWKLIVNGAGAYIRLVTVSGDDFYTVRI